jgi:hypothetical protein
MFLETLWIYILSIVCIACVDFMQKEAAMVIFNFW